MTLTRLAQLMRRNHALFMELAAWRSECNDRAGAAAALDAAAAARYLLSQIKQGLGSFGPPITTQRGNESCSTTP